MAQTLADEAPPVEPPALELEPELEPELETDSDLAPDAPLELPFDPVESLVDQLLEIHQADHFASCEETEGIVLNEICAAGTECDPDVRIRDYVELYNPGKRSVELSCFVLTARDYVAFSPSGLLEPGGFRGFGEVEMGFRIAKRLDSVALYRLTIGLDGEPLLAESESVEIDEDRVHLYRSPDGGSWQVFALAEAEEGWPGSFGSSNHVPSETPRGEARIEKNGR